MAVPKNGWFIRENLAKIDDFGYPYFRKPPWNLHIISHWNIPMTFEACHCWSWMQTRHVDILHIQIPTLIYPYMYCIHLHISQNRSKIFMGYFHGRLGHLLHPLHNRCLQWPLSGSSDCRSCLQEVRELLWSPLHVVEQLRAPSESVFSRCRKPSDGSFPRGWRDFADFRGTFSHLFSDRKHHRRFSGENSGEDGWCKTSSLWYTLT